MPDLADGESIQVQGSGSKPYELKNIGGVYSCTCPAWRNQSLAIEKRTCKHLRALRGEDAEEARIGEALPRKPAGAAGAKPSAPPLLLAESWLNDVDLAGWWMSEKLDGVRAYWDGKQLISRLGNLYHAPDWFVEGLPDLPLDGELWIARKKFQRTVSIVRRQDKSDHWREIRYVVFDAPGLDKDFETRLAFFSDHLRREETPYVRAHEHLRCEGIDHLRRELARVESLGGEGLMMRRPRSRYEVGRSATLLKVKNFQDAEARVMKHLEGAGRHKGRLGALQVELPDGTTFSVGTGFSDAERENPPPVGSVICFRYQELSDGGVPRFPSYVGIRLEAAPLPANSAGKEPVSTPAKRSKASPSQPSSTKGESPMRHFEFVEGSSNKFWEISVAGKEVTVRFGRIGSQGQTKTKEFADDDAAKAHAEKLIEEKTGKGYVEK
jgi:DNA ligase 1